MTEETKFSAWINPLSFLEVEMPCPQEQVGLAEVMAFLCSPDESCEITAIISRYRAIKEGPTKHLHIAPAEGKLLPRIVWPLKHAIGSYMLGNYCGTMALCGMVCEMLAIFLYEITPLMTKFGTLNKKGEAALFGRELERLGQDRRIRILEALGVISQETAKKLEEVRVTRNHYLHWLSHDDANAAEDACRLFARTLEAVVEGLGFDIVKGKVVFRQGVLDAITRGNAKADTKP